MLNDLLLPFLIRKQALESLLARKARLGAVRAFGTDRKKSSAIERSCGRTSHGTKAEAAERDFKKNEKIEIFLAFWQEDRR